jgi:hypothetical protein
MLAHYFGDVRVGTIAERVGNPHDTDPWEWSGAIGSDRPRGGRIISRIMATVNSSAVANPSRRTENRSFFGWRQTAHVRLIVALRDFFCAIAFLRLEAAILLEGRLLLRRLRGAH